MTNHTLKSIVAQLDHVHAARLAADKTAKELASEEAGLKLQLIAFMREQEVASIGSDHYMFSVKEKTRINVTDWEQVFTYIKQHDSFDLLYKRLNEAAVLARAEEGDPVPGTEPYPLDDLSIRKR